jgi:hypothetical protein
MTIQQLLENAHLDALGMLDADEQTQFNKAFASAPPAIRAQIRGEQARVADMGDLLPDVTPVASAARSRARRHLRGDARGARPVRLIPMCTTFARQAAFHAGGGPRRSA